MHYQHCYYCYLNYQLTVSLYLIAKLLINNMPRQSNDEDLVTYTRKPTKGPAPVPPPIPLFEPLVYAQSENLSCLLTSIRETQGLYLTYFLMIELLK